MKKIIGLTGEIGAGKDTFCEYLKKKYKDIFVFRFSDILLDMLKIISQEAKRDDLQWLGSVLKDRFGEDILVKALFYKIENISDGIIIFNGIRAKKEAQAIIERGGKIVYITAQQKIRWKRVKIRGEKKDDNVPFRVFKEREKFSTEVVIPEIGKKADYKIENNGSKEEFYKKIDGLIKVL